MEKKEYHLSKIKELTECGLKAHFQDQGLRLGRSGKAIIGSAFHHCMEFYGSIRANEDKKVFKLHDKGYPALYEFEQLSSISDLNIYCDELVGIMSHLIDIHEFGPEVCKDIIKEFIPEDYKIFKHDTDFSEPAYWDKGDREKVINSELIKFKAIFKHLINWFETSEFMFLETEKLLEFEIDGRKIKTTLDAVGQDGDKLVILDYKTNATRPIQWELEESPQYNGYALGYGRMTNSFPSEFWHIQARDFEEYARGGTFYAQTISDREYLEKDLNDIKAIPKGQPKGPGIHKFSLNNEKIMSYELDFLASIYSYEHGYYTRAKSGLPCKYCNFHTECTSYYMNNKPGEFKEDPKPVHTVTQEEQNEMEALK